jgi:CelD/BcsL family acetyltransferase involved in cellulose biosynthesis
MSKRITVSETTAEQIADEWCTLLRASASPYPYQHPAWHDAWWSRFGAERAPVLVTVREGARLVVVAPLMRDCDRLLFAGDPEICDYMDLIAAPDADRAAYDRMLDALAAEPWRELVLWGIPEHSRTLQLLPGLAQARGWKAEEEFEAVCPRVTLPETWEAYLESLSKKDRHELRRKLRRLSEAGSQMRYYALSAPEEVRAGLDDFIRLHTASRHDKRQFMTPEMESFFRAMAPALAEQGMVRLFFVELDGKRVAALLAFDTGTDLLLYNSGYDPAYSFASVGLVSKALTLKAAIESGKRAFDFMRGAEPYKYDMGGKDLEVHTLTLTRAMPA